MLYVLTYNRSKIRFYHTRLELRLVHENPMSPYFQKFSLNCDLSDCTLDTRTLTLTLNHTPHHTHTVHSHAHTLLHTPSLSPSLISLTLILSPSLTSLVLILIHSPSFTLAHSHSLTRDAIEGAIETAMIAPPRLRLLIQIIANLL